MCATLTKLDAAHRQLNTAIRMYFAGDDIVAVHTLACAAREIYEKHCKKREIDRMFEHIMTANPEYGEKRLWDVLNGARNFFKHPGESLDEAIELGDADNKYMLFVACHDCTMLCGKQSPAEVQVFNIWFLATEFPMNVEGQAAANDIMRSLDSQFPGLRTAPLAEQKARGSLLLADVKSNRFPRYEQEWLMNHDTNDTRPEIDLHEVLKQRVEAGEPIYINKQTTRAIDATIERIAEETGKPVKLVQIVDLPAQPASSK